MRQRIHPKFSDSTPCMHLFLINSKATPPAHTAEESVWMLLGQCSTIASLPKKPQLHFLFNERVSIIPPIHKSCIGHYKKKEEPLLNPYTRLQTTSYLTTEFLQPLHCYMPFIQGVSSQHLWNGWGKTKTSPSQSRFNSLPPVCASYNTKATNLQFPSITLRQSHQDWWQQWCNRDRSVKALQSLT